MSLKQIAALAECAPSTIHAWTTGSMPCERMANLRKLCDGIGVPIEAALTANSLIATNSDVPYSSSCSL